MAITLTFLRRAEILRNKHLRFWINMDDTRKEKFKDECKTLFDEIVDNPEEDDVDEALDILSAYI